MPLSEEEIRSLLTQTEGLAFLKGKWIEVDHARLKELLIETMLLNVDKPSPRVIQDADLTELFMLP